MLQMSQHLPFAYQAGGADLHPNFSSVAFACDNLREQLMRKVSANLFVGLTIFAAGALIETGCFSGNEALAASRGYSPGSLSQGRGTSIGPRYTGSSRDGRRVTGPQTNFQKATGPKEGGMGGSWKSLPQNSRVHHPGQRRTATGRDPVAKGRADYKRSSARRSIDNR